MPYIGVLNKANHLMEITNLVESTDEGTMVGINLGTFCNQNCTFCLAKGGHDAFPRLGLDEALEVIDRYVSAGRSNLMFTGGEITIHPDFLSIIRAALDDSRVRSVNLMTNGTVLSNRSLFDALIKSDPVGNKLSFSFSLHGHTKEISESITRGQEGDFEKTCEAMRSAIESGHNADVAFIILEQNYRYLPDYAKFILNSFPGMGGVSFGYPLLCGNAKDNKDWIYAKFSDIAPYLREAIKIIDDGGMRVVTAAGAPMPLCAIPGMEEVSVRPLIEWNRNFLGTATSKRISAHKDEDKLTPKIKPDGCSSCVINAACVGVLESYFDIFGSDGINAVTTSGFNGPIVEAKSINEALPELDKKKLNLVVLDDNETDPGLYVFPEGKIGVIIKANDDKLA